MHSKPLIFAFYGDQIKLLKNVGVKPQHSPSIVTGVGLQTLNRRREEKGRFLRFRFLCAFEGAAKFSFKSTRYCEIFKKLVSPVNF